MPIPEQERGGFSPHGPECWRVHPTCAVAEVERLQADLAAVAHAMLRVERADMTKPLGPQVAACFDLLIRTTKHLEDEQEAELAMARREALEGAAGIF